MNETSQTWKQLYEAMCSGDMSKLDALINNGVDINERNCYNETPLLSAIMDLGVPCEDAPRNADRMNIVSEIVARGADINALDNDGHGIFDVPIFQIDLELIEHLLNIGAHPNNGINSGGDSILDLAHFDYRALYFAPSKVHPHTDADLENFDTWLAFMDREAVRNDFQRPVCLRLLRDRGARTSEELSALGKSRV